MSALWTIAAFECRQRLRQVSSLVYFALYATLGGLWMAAAGGAIKGATVAIGSEKIAINSPYALAVTVAILGFLGVTVIAAGMGRAIQQDFEYGTYPFLYSAPIHKRDYFFGRFLGAQLSLLLIFTGILLGIEIGIHWPGVDSARVGADSWQALLRPFLLLLLPNLLWLGAVFFVIAALSRQMAPVYIAGVLTLIGYLASLNLLSDVDNKQLAALVDPVGTTALDVLARYWSVAEKNTRQIGLDGALLWNRLLWCSLGLIVLAIGYARFQLEVLPRAPGRRRRPAAAATATAGSPAPALAVMRVPAPQRALDGSAWLRTLPALLGLYLRESLRSPRFLALVLAGVLLILSNASTLGAIYGTNTWPVTYQVLELTSGLFQLFILITTAIYAGELIWREREARLDEIIDTTPQPLWLPYSAKLLALLVIQAVLLSVVAFCSLGIQLWYGHVPIEPGHLLFELYALQWPTYAILAALAVTVHVLVNQKYLSHFIVASLFLVRLKLPDFGYQDRLYLYGAEPAVHYSDMNGYGTQLDAARAFQLYWGAAALLLLLLCTLFWVRGKDTHWRQRLRAARQRSVPAWRIAAAAVIVLMGASGAWIYHNTHGLNPYYSTLDVERLRADYERRYKSLADAPQPQVSAIDLQADLYPHAHRAALQGHYTLVNRSTQAISELYLRLPPYAELRRFDSPLGLQLRNDAWPLPLRQYHLQQPLAPGAQSSVDFDIVYAVHGFGNDGPALTVLDNGTFINGAFGTQSARLPAFGYDDGLELASDRERKKFGLAPKERMPDLDDARAQMRAVEWLQHYTATLSTSAEQTAITSGELVRQWTVAGDDGPRRYFRYESHQPILNYLPILSGRYVTLRDQWQGRGHRVAIEIDHDAAHPYDLARMMNGVKDALSYFDAHFSPYQFPLLRIIEFPRYERFAESFANTVPFSEAIGFIARVNDNDAKDIDYPYFVTAHEVAHQWWGHQINPAEVQGAQFVTESLAEYSALLVLKHKYGDTKMHRFLRYELDRYLFGRSQESKKEQPLLRADGASYLHYQKGALALYALQDAIGEDRVDDALAAFLRDWAYRGPPYPTSRDLLAELRKVTPAEQQGLIDDLFERIVLYDNRAVRAQVHALDGGRYAIDFDLETHKVYADGLGAETPAAFDENIDVGALDSKGVPLVLQKIRLHDGANHVQFISPARPAKIGVDPILKLIDRDPDNNLIAAPAPS